MMGRLGMGVVLIAGLASSPSACSCSDGAAVDAGDEIELIAEGYQDPQDIVVDENFVYYSVLGPGDGPGWLLRVPKHGGESVVLASGPNRYYGIEQDDEHIYFMSNAGIQPNSVIFRVRKSGENLTALATGQHGTIRLALDDAYVYWQSSDERISRVAKTGGETSILVEGILTASDLLVRDDQVYFTVGGFESVMRAPRDGTGDPIEVIGNVRGARALVDDDRALYFSTDEEEPGHRIYRFELATSVAEILVEEPHVRKFLAVDDNYLYYATMTGTEVKAVPKAGGTPFTVVVDPDGEGARAVAVDDEYLYWTNWVTGAVRRTLKPL